MQTFNLWNVAQRTRALRSNPALAYRRAFALVCVAVAARLAGGSLLSSFPFLTFYPPVVIAAFLCGPGPALMTGLMGLGLSVYFMFDVTSTLRFEGGGLAIAIGFYVCTNALIIALTDGMLGALERQHATARRLELAINAGGMAVWEYDLPSEAMVATPELNQLLGLPPTAALDVAQVQALTSPSQWDRLRQVARQAIAAGDRFFEMEFQARRPDEVLRWYALNAEILRAQNGEPEKILGVLTDITARKDVEWGLEEAIERLKEREDELNAVMDVSGIAPFDFDPVAMVFKPSPRLNRIYGYPKDHTLTIEDLRARYDPLEGDNYAQDAADRAADRALGPYELDLRLMMPDGKTKWVHGRGEYIRDSSGRAVRSRGLVMDITARKELEETRELLVKELDHRIKNLLATVGAICAQTLRGTITLEQGRTALDGRLAVLAAAHELLTRHQWQDMDMRQVVERALAPHHAGAQIGIEGPDCLLTPKRGLALTLALHELATNAMKYGALSVAAGRVKVGWGIAARNGHETLEFAWEESGGPAVTVPSRRGFGTRIIERVLAADFSGTARLDYCPEGLCCSLVCPLHPEA